MLVQEKNIKDIHPYEKNPRINEKAAYGVAESIKAYGFKVPLVITENGEIVCGHTRYKAAKILGLKKVPCIVADDLTPAQAKAFRLADNKTSDLSIWDNRLLLDELEYIAGLEEDLFTGFDLGDLFDHTLDEAENRIIKDNENGIMYEAKFCSEDKTKIDRLQKLWEDMSYEK